MCHVFFPEAAQSKAQYGVGHIMFSPRSGQISGVGFECNQHEVIRKDFERARTFSSGFMLSDSPMTSSSIYDYGYSPLRTSMRFSDEELLEVGNMHNQGGPLDQRPPTPRSVHREFYDHNDIADSGGDFCFVTDDIGDAEDQYFPITRARDTGLESDLEMKTA